MIDNLKKLLLISRPISWVNTAYPFAAGYLVTGGEINAFFFFATFFFLIPYNLIMYGINDVYDYESDIRNPRKGGIEGAKEQKAFHPVILRAAALCTLLFFIPLIIFDQSNASFVLAAVFFFVVAYSQAGLRFKEIPLLDSVTSSVHFVGPLVYALVLTGFSVDAIPYILAFFLWGMASHAFGAIQDIVPDRQAGIRSIATLFGAAATARFAFILYATSIFLVLIQGFPAVLVGFAGVSYLFTVAPYLNLSDQDSSRANRGWRRFIWLNMFTGFVITIAIIISYLPTS